MKTDNKIDLSKRTKGTWYFGDERRKSSRYGVGEWAQIELYTKYDSGKTANIGKLSFNGIGGKDDNKYSEAEANAAYIVLAVNTFDKLVEALKGFIHSVEHEGEIHGRIVDAVRNTKQLLQSIEKQQKEICK